MNRTVATFPLMILMAGVVPAAAADDAPPAVTAPAPAPERDPRPGMSVDYILGLMEAGMQEGLIVDLVRSRDLKFDLLPGDLDRLMAAGAGEALIGIVVRNGRQVDAPSWSRPRRIGDDAAGGEMEPAGEEESETSQEGRWYGGFYAYVGAPYPYGYWAYPYLYPYPYYSYYYDYPYRYGYSYPYRYGHHRGSAPPRGYGAPRQQDGWHSYPPRGSGGAPRGGSSGSRPPSSRPPRGSR